MTVVCGCLVWLWLPLNGATPATVMYEEHSWRNDSWGFHAVHGHRRKVTAAFSSSGSVLQRTTWSAYQYRFLSAKSGESELLWLADRKTLHGRTDGRTTEPQEGCSREVRKEQRRDDDAECSATAREFFGRTPTRAGSGEIAGHRVVRWKAGDEIALAPERGCETLERIHTAYGTFGIPVSGYRFVVTSYQPGEPDRSLFRIPSK